MEKSERRMTMDIKKNIGDFIKKWGWPIAVTAFAFITEKVAMDRDARVKELEAILKVAEPVSMESLENDPTVEFEQED